MFFLSNHINNSMQTNVVYGKTRESSPQCVFGTSVRHCLEQIGADSFVFGFRIYVKEPMQESRRNAVLRSAASRLWRNLGTPDEPFVQVNQEQHEFSDSMFMHQQYDIYMRRLLLPEHGIIVNDRYAVGMMCIRPYHFYGIDNTMPRLHLRDAQLDSSFNRGVAEFERHILRFEFRTCRVRIGSRVITSGSLYPADQRTSDLIKLVHCAMTSDAEIEPFNVLVYVSNSGKPGWAIPDGYLEYCVPEPEVVEPEVVEPKVVEPEVVEPNPDESMNALYTALVGTFGDSLVVAVNVIVRRNLRPKLYLQNFIDAVGSAGWRAVYDSIVADNDQLIKELNECGKTTFKQRYNASDAMFKKCAASNNLLVGIVK